MKNLFIKLSIILPLISTGQIVSADTCPVVEPETISMKIGGKDAFFSASCRSLVDYIDVYDGLGNRSGGIEKANTWYFRYTLPEMAPLSAKIFIKFAIDWAIFKGDAYVGIQMVNAENKIIKQYARKAFKGHSYHSISRLHHSFLEQVNLEDAEYVQVSITPAEGPWRSPSKTPPEPPELSLITFK